MKLDILLSGDMVDALSMVVTRIEAYDAGPAMVGAPAQADSPPAVRGGDPGVHRLQDHRPRAVNAVRKDVIAKCYGGDITRKRKLLEQQKEGKKRMKQVGRIEVPQEAFLSVLQIGEDGKG